MILLTGANGFVGQAFLAHSQQHGRALQVRAAVRSFDSKSSPSNLFFDAHLCVAPDLGPEADWSEALKGISTVVHCAARVHVMQDLSVDPMTEYRRVNVEGTLALARQAVRAGVRRFVFVSSIKVNGESTEPGLPFSQSSTPMPSDPYGQSKFEAEQSLLELARTTGLEVVVVRPPLVYGPEVKANFASLLRAIQRGWPLPFGAAKTNLRSLVYVGNLVDLLWVCTEHPAATGQVFLVSDKHDFSTFALVNSMATATGRKARLISIPVGLLRALAILLGRKAMADRLFGNLQLDIAHTCQTLNWHPPFTVNQGLKTLLKQS